MSALIYIFNVECRATSLFDLGVKGAPVLSTHKQNIDNCVTTKYSDNYFLDINHWYV